jgi:ribulose-phosphate 3-epimerase
MSTVKIAPSLLAANFACLGEEIKAIEPFADMIHLDVMDGHFVPNLTFGPLFIKALRSYTSLPFDVHLMVTCPDNYLTEFAQAGANIITVHLETCENLPETLQKIRELGCKAGLALKPDTPAETLSPFLHLVDLILVMTVEPGFGGQSFLTDQIKKIQDVRALVAHSDYSIVIEVDGGISPINAPAVIEAGADIIVVGTAAFKGDPSHYAENIEALRH